MPIRVRQAGASEASWQVLPPQSRQSFAWEDLLGRRLLELMVDGASAHTTRCFPIDTEAHIEPATTGQAVAPLVVTVSRPASMAASGTGGSGGGVEMLVTVRDWLPSSMPMPVAVMGGSHRGGEGVGGSEGVRVEALRAVDLAGQRERKKRRNFMVLLSVDDFGLSVIDHVPEELLYASIVGAQMSYLMDEETGSTRTEVGARKGS